MNRRLTALAALVLLTAPAGADDATDDSEAQRLARVAAIAVTVEDTVRDYCLPQPMSELHTLQIDAEQILRRAGIAVAGGPPAHTLRIAVTGGAPDGACQAHIELALRPAASTAVSGVWTVPAYFSSIGVEAPEPGFEQAVRLASGGLVSALTDAIVQARGR